MLIGVKGGSGHAEPDPVDVGVHNRPLLPVPPLIVRQPSLDERKVRPHRSLRHAEDPRDSDRRVAEKLRDS
jgi:hypothetical protein